LDNQQYGAKYKKCQIVVFYSGKAHENKKFGKM